MQSDNGSGGPRDAGGAPRRVDLGSRALSGENRGGQGRSRGRSGALTARGSGTVGSSRLAMPAKPSRPKPSHRMPEAKARPASPRPAGKPHGETVPPLKGGNGEERTACALYGWHPGRESEGRCVRDRLIWDRDTSCALTAESNVTSCFLGCHTNVKPFVGSIRCEDGLPRGL